MVTAHVPRSKAVAVLGVTLFLIMNIVAFEMWTAQMARLLLLCSQILKFVVSACRIITN